jgi:hypothetical protein
VYYSLVIRFNEKMNVRIAFMNGKEQTELNSNDFRPTNVTAVFAPSSTEFPGIPFIVEDNSDAP